MVRGNRSRRGTSRRLNRVVRRVDRIRDGHKYVPGLQPTTITFVPWNQCVVVIKHSADKIYTPIDVANLLRDQIGLYTGTTTKAFISIQLRFEKVSLWSTQVAQGVILKAYDLHRLDELAVLYDWPGVARNARLGYQWPRAQQHLSFEHDNASTPIFAVDTAGTAPSSGFLIYVYVLWRGLEGTVGNLLFKDVALQHRSSESIEPLEHQDWSECSSPVALVTRQLTQLTTESSQVCSSCRHSVVQHSVKD